MAQKAQSPQSIPKSVYGVVVGAAIGTFGVWAKPQWAAYVLAGLTIVAAYTFFVSYQKATSKKWSPRSAFSATPILGALVVGVMAVSGAQYLGSSSAASIGSIISVKGCENLSQTASGNIGSIVKIDGGGTCNIDTIMQSPALKGNIGSIVVVDNACGDAAAAKAKFNIGSIVKVTSIAPCKVDQPTTVVVQPAPSPTPAAVVDAPVPVAKAAELPATGPSNLIIIALTAIVVGYLFSAVYKLKTGSSAKR